MRPGYEFRLVRIPPREGDAGHEWVQETWQRVGMMPFLGKRVCRNCQRQPFECHGPESGIEFAPCPRSRSEAGSISA